MTPDKPTTDAGLELLQHQSFSYFLHETNPQNGLVRDKTAPDWPASIAATGLALAVYPVAVERSFITRAAAITTILATLRFFWNRRQGPEADATGYRGFYYHFLDMETGRRAWRCELSTVDSAILLAGMLTAGAYFDADTPEEDEIRTLADALYRRADWPWAQNGGATVTHGWNPESGFLRWRWEGYDEALVLYILGLGSPTHPLPESSYAAWTTTYRWERCYGHDYLYAGPLFTHQLSHIWVDFRGIQDAYMRAKGSDYFENSRRATHVQREYAIDNPLKFAHYGRHCWGLTASEGPGPATINVGGMERKFFDYVGRGVPYGPDDGTIAPWAVAASLPFAPEIVLPALDHCIHELKLTESNRYGFKASFNPTYPAAPGMPHGWVSPWHFGLNEGPTVLMVENYRTGLLWQLMRGCPYIAGGLRRAGFTGGWL
ncbi:MAG: glucoamylase family protein [Gammaproteobacteria bacterium]